MDMSDVAAAVIEWVPVVVMVASVVTAATPTPKDDQALSKIYRIIEMFGLVVGKAKEKGERSPRS